MGERKEWDRIYDYDYYNDLGDVDKGSEHFRPVLGGSRLYPYPRRVRTGRKNSTSGTSRSQATSFDIYVPSDEIFSPKKLKELKSNSIHAIVQLLPSKTESLPQQSSRSVQSFEEILNMLSRNRNQTIEGWIRDNLKKLVPNEDLKEITHAIKENHMHDPIPQNIYGKRAQYDFYVDILVN